MTNSQLLNQSCTYWSLTDAERAEISASAPDQDEWTFELYRLPNSFWAFDMPELKTHQELLVGNTEKILDQMYLNHAMAMADEDSRMAVTISRVPMQDADTVCDFKRRDPSDAGSTIWEEVSTGEEMWLCPWLTNNVWREPPTRIWAKFKILC